MGAFKTDYIPDPCPRCEQETRVIQYDEGVEYESCSNCDWEEV